MRARFCTTACLDGRPAFRKLRSTMYCEHPIAYPCVSIVRLTVRITAVALSNTAHVKTQTLGDLTTQRYSRVLHVTSRFCGYRCRHCCRVADKSAYNSRTRMSEFESIDIVCRRTIRTDVRSAASICTYCEGVAQGIHAECGAVYLSSQPLPTHCRCRCTGIYPSRPSQCLNNTRVSVTGARGCLHSPSGTTRYRITTPRLAILLSLYIPLIFRYVDNMVCRIYIW